ncbi:MAG: hypothetical protein P1U42_09270 [Phycisphaerales bacterium]|jgi:hypothetical protein|nr:hypothetical protein [Phycisphaerales bacterium]
MDDLDSKIRKALNNSDAAMIGDPNDGLRLDQQVLGVFKGGNPFMNTIAMTFSFVFLGIAIYCAVRFFDTNVTKELLAWGFGFCVSFMAVSMFKIWFWMEMQRIAVTREVKRVELLSARLLQELASK